MNLQDTTTATGISISGVTRPNVIATRKPLQEISLAYVEELELVCDEWQALEKDAANTPFQTYAWTHAWRCHVHRAAEADPAIVVGKDDRGNVQFILPFAIRKQGPAKILEWLAGDHASYTGALYTKQFLESITHDNTLVLWSRIKKLLPHFDISQFLAQLPTLNGFKNPMTCLSHRENASTYYSITIDADWETLHQERRSRSTRRSERKRERLLGEFGPVSFDVHYDGPDLERATEVMFSQKSARFAELGINDFLNEPGMTDFYRALTKMTETAHGIEGFVSTLSVGDNIVGALFNMIYKNKNFSLVSSMTTDEKMRKPSPGEILMRHTLKHCCEAGLEAYDCGGGNDIYKDSWSDVKFHTLDSVTPNSLLGSTYTSGFKGFLAAKAQIKQSPVLWKTFKNLRKLGFWS